jgi:hypothetical protein
MRYDLFRLQRPNPAFSHLAAARVAGTEEQDLEPTHIVWCFLSKARSPIYPNHSLLGRLLQCQPQLTSAQATQLIEGHLAEPFDSSRISRDLIVSAQLVPE